MHKPLQLDPPSQSSASNDASAVDFDCAALWQRLLDESLKNNVRIVQIEQESDCCRLRISVRGLFTEERLNSPTVASELRRYVQETLPPEPVTEPDKLVSCVSHRGVKCRIECHWYHTVHGDVLVVQIFNERNIPETLEQTSLDQQSILSIRQSLRQQHRSMMLISSKSSELLCDMYYALLGELTSVETTVISFESNARKEIPRISQITERHESSHIPEHTSFVFADWNAVRNAELLNKLLSGYQNTFIFSHADDLPQAIRQLTDTAQCERQLATNLRSLWEFDRVRLICPHCASALLPGKLESRILSEGGIAPDSTLNYASGCEQCDHTGYGQDSTLSAFYDVNDALRELLEKRNTDEIRKALDSEVPSIEEQRNSLISGGNMEFKFSATG